MKTFCNAIPPENVGVFRGYSIARGTNNIFWSFKKWRERRMFLVFLPCFSFCAITQFLYALKTSENLFKGVFGMKYLSFKSVYRRFQWVYKWNLGMKWNKKSLRMNGSKHSLLHPMIDGKIFFVTSYLHFLLHYHWYVVYCHIVWLCDPLLTAPWRKKNKIEMFVSTIT